MSSVLLFARRNLHSMHEQVLVKQYQPYVLHFRKCLLKLPLRRSGCLKAEEGTAMTDAELLISRGNSLMTTKFNTEFYVPCATSGHSDGANPVYEQFVRFY